MTSATQSFHDRTAIVFDFDLTLAPSTLDALLQRCGADPDAWKRETIRPLLDQGFEEILAKIYGLIRMSSAGPVTITRDMVEETGRDLEPYQGVPAMFDRLRQVAQHIAQDLQVEFHVISSGLFEVMAATAVASHVDSLWGTKLHFDERTGELDFPRLVLTHPEKVRYLLALCKGLDPTGPNAPAHVYQDVAAEDWHVPLDQFIYVGDGSSDMAVFRLLNDRGGIAIGIYKGDQADGWRGMERMDPDRRVQNLAPTDYGEGSELMQSLVLAVESVARKVALRRLGAKE
ncbi:HAD family hydrolase [Microvirga roseola]|uniref:HAD family hydrolase n=1 Tax=Microvirga roseola TaxID=2883126 RepID=UPI001E372E24|nr:HAD family hydrolase [Microvirga roseola]